ncbi:MAG: hypothetical protein ACK56F_28130, partial [bacterium]
EIMRSKVAAIGGNCILGYKIKINNLKEEYNYQGQAIFIAVSAIGDAVEVLQGFCGSENQEQEEDIDNESNEIDVQISPENKNLND